ncbi:MAG: histidine kinase [Spirosomataceae bacterium]
MRTKPLKIVGHFLFWLSYFLYEWLVWGSTDDQYQKHFFWASMNVPLVAGVTYFNIFLVRKFLLNGQTRQFWLSFVSSLVLFACIRRVMNYECFYPFYYPEACTQQPLFYLPKMVIETVGMYLYVGVGVMAYFVEKWYSQEQFTQSLLRDKAEAELELLKSQIQPHFIFNTLNNIYALSKKNSPQTSEMIHRLSGLLSYMLYDSKLKLIPIEKEIDYIQNYINLEKIRYGERLDVALNVFQQVQGIQIPPLILLPLVENAFKHGISQQLKDSWIRVDISRKEPYLVVKVENSLKDQPEETYIPNGLGLENLRKRLEMLYPDRHELKILNEPESFLVVMKIAC